MQLQAHSQVFNIDWYEIHGNWVKMVLLNDMAWKLENTIK